MSDLVGNHIVGFPTRRLISLGLQVLPREDNGQGYENLPMQYTQIFLTLKIENFQLKNFDSFLIFP